MIRRITSNNLSVLSSRVTNNFVRAMSTPSTDKKKKKNYAQSDSEKAHEEMHEGFFLFMEAHDKAMKWKVEWDPETAAEHKRIGREYQIQSFKRHGQTVKRYADGIWFQRCALRALPEDLRKKALIIDETRPPHTENLFYTPPIKGFDSTKYEEEAVQEDME